MSSSGVWASVPECHFFQPLRCAVREEDLQEASRAFHICLRPDAAHTSAQNPSATLVTCIVPSSKLSGRHTMTQLVTWSPVGGADSAVPEITDACALCWSAGDSAWQLLSPIFGILMLQEASLSERTVMPVTPLLEAAVTRQLAGDGMPGLAEGLVSHNALEPATPPLLNPVDAFSYALVNTLPKDAAAAHRGIGDTLLRKQQQHAALLQCLHSAGLLVGSATEASRTAQLPPEAIFDIFQHSEHLTAAASLFYECSAPSGSAAAQADYLDALAIACALLEPPAEQRYTASEWAFSSPSSNLPLLMRGIRDACAAAVSAHGGATDGDSMALGKLAALCDLACATLKGAKAAQQTAASQFGSFYEPWLAKGGAGWLAGADVREACVALVQQCLHACVAGLPEEWVERLLLLGGHIVASYKRAIDALHAEAAPEATIENLVAEAQSAVSDIVSAVRLSAQGASTARAADSNQLILRPDERHPYALANPMSMIGGPMAARGGSVATGGVAEDVVLLQRLQGLASSPLETASASVAQPRIACAEQLLQLCDGHLQLEHRRAVAAAGHPSLPYIPRLLAQLPPHLDAYHGHSVQHPGPPPSQAEQEARETLHSLMQQHPAFLSHALHVYCTERRAVELLLLPEAFHDRVADALASAEQWKGMAWLFHNARGDHAQAASCLSRLVVTGDPSGHAGKLLAPSQSLQHTLPTRAALLHKATMHLRLRAGAAAADAAAAGASGLRAAAAAEAGGAGVASGLAVAGAGGHLHAQVALLRELEEGDVLLQAQKLKARLPATDERAASSREGSTEGTCHAEAYGAVEGLDVEKVLETAANSGEEEVVLEAVCVAARLAACSGGWLERQRDVTWAALWRALGTLGSRHFEQVAGDMRDWDGVERQSLHDSALYTGLCTSALILKRKPALAMQAAKAAAEHAQEAIQAATGVSNCAAAVRTLHDHALSASGVVPAL